MKVFIIQPNYAAKSEVWLHRMNVMLQNCICGMATYLKDENVVEPYPVFNLNGRGPSRYERWLIRLRIRNYDSQKIMRKELYNIILRSGTDLLIVHYATVADCFWDVIQSLSVPIYIYVHGHDVIWDHNDNYGKKLHSDNYIERIRAISKNNNVKFIVSSNCSAKNLLFIGVEKTKICSKIFGVNLPFINRNYNKAELRILFLGRLVDYKGPDLVINAFFLACDMGFKGQLVIAGDGPLRIMCELIAKRSKYSDRVQFIGEVTKKKAEELFIEADIYTMHNCKGLLSKGYDTFGVSVIEAMSYGLPVVTGDVGGPAEIINNEVDGIVIEADNVYAQALAFQRLFENPSLRCFLGSNARAKITSNYHCDIEKKELYKILKISRPTAPQL